MTLRELFKAIKENITEKELEELRNNRDKYVRIDLHVFNSGFYFEYNCADTFEPLLSDEDYPEHWIVEVEELLEELDKEEEYDEPTEIKGDEKEYSVTIEEGGKATIMYGNMKGLTVEAVSDGELDAKESCEKCIFYRNGHLDNICLKMNCIQDRVHYIKAEE